MALIKMVCIFFLERKNKNSEYPFDTTLRFLRDSWPYRLAKSLALKILLGCLLHGDASEWLSHQLPEHLDE